MPADAPYPFPGLNPYFEKEWFQVHPSMIVYARNQMQRQMPVGLHVSIEHGITLSGQPPVEDESRRPDVSVWKLREDAVLTNTPANYSPPLCVDVQVPKPRHLAIREMHDRRLITILEFLSPGNKHGGGAITYARKRQDVVSAGVNLVEVDLIRKWGLALLQFEDECVAGRLRDTSGVLPAHAVTVIRAAQESRREIYPIHYPQPLPACLIPLRADDPDVWLDLQKAARQCHIQCAFDKSTDYTRDPEPPLSPEDTAWLHAHLKKHELR